ncbi:MAG: ATP-binding protein, partial [Opitutus sp.]
AHGTTGEPRLMQVRHLARDIIEVIEETFPKSIKLEQNFAADTWPIRANPTQIHQVLLNLCVNARDAMPRGGQLRLRTTNRRLEPAQALAIPGARPGAFVVLEVSDTGTGIPPEALKHIWEPFFTTKEAGKGTGLGLSTVRGIVESHQGFIELETAPDRGTTFLINLPAAEADASADTLAPAPYLPRGDGQLLLLVDDESANRDVTHATLARYGYRVLAASSGTEAVSIFIPRSDEIRLLITDLHMPNLDGASLTRILQRIKPGLKVLVISGLSSGPAGTETERPEQFANDYL